MRIFLISFFTCLISLLPATASTTREEIRGLALAMDVGAVEAKVSQAHRDSVAGEISYDDLREIFRVFTTTDPKIWAFTEVWIEDEPDSPYAQTGLAWLYYTNGWHMRGSRAMNGTHPKALAEYRAMHQRSMRLAQAAWSTAPDLVPATDAVLRLLKTVGDSDSVNTILSQVMEVTPNYGSIERAMSVTDRNWGGSFQTAVDNCLEFAPMVTEISDFTADICLIKLAFEYKYGSEVDALARKTLREIDHPFLDNIRHKTWVPGISPTTDKKIVAYLNGEGSTDLEAAQEYDAAVTYPEGKPALGPIVFENLRTKTLAELEMDPLNNRLHKILITRMLESGSVLEDPIPYDEAMVLLKSGLEVGPYDARIWYDLASMSHQHNISPLDATENQYYENAIALSMGDPQYIARYLSAKTFDRTKVPDYVEGGEINASNQTQYDEAVNCPIIRLSRYIQMVCQHRDYPQLGCATHNRDDEYFAEIFRGVEQRNVCIAERTGDIEDLMFTAPGESEY